MKKRKTNKFKTIAGHIISRASSSLFLYCSPASPPVVALKSSSNSHMSASIPLCVCVYLCRSVGWSRKKENRSNGQDYNELKKNPFGISFRTSINPPPSSALTHCQQQQQPPASLTN